MQVRLQWKLDKKTGTCELWIHARKNTLNSWWKMADGTTPWVPSGRPLNIACLLGFCESRKFHNIQVRSPPTLSTLERKSTKTYVRNLWVGIVWYTRLPTHISRPLADWTWSNAFLKMRPWRNQPYLISAPGNKVHYLSIMCPPAKDDSTRPAIH